MHHGQRIGSSSNFPKTGPAYVHPLTSWHAAHSKEDWTIEPVAIGLGWYLNFGKAEAVSRQSVIDVQHIPSSWSAVDNHDVVRRKTEVSTTLSLSDRCPRTLRLRERAGSDSQFRGEGNLSQAKSKWITLR